MLDPGTTTHTIEWVMARALADERVRSTRRVALIRLGGVALLFALSAWLGIVRNDTSWRANLSIFGLYFAATALLAILCLWVPRAARFAGLGVPLVDLPAVYLLQRIAMPASPFPAGVAGFTLGVFCALVALAALSLDARVLALAAAVASALEIAL